MDSRLTLRKGLMVFTFVVYLAVIVQILTQNLTVDTDYPAHMHNIWAVSRGYLFSDPFIGGGSAVPLKYGSPLYLSGALLWPVFQEYTAGLFLIAAIVPMGYLSRKIFDHFCESRTADVAAIITVINPLTIYYFLTAKLPFIWGVVFALASIYLFLEGKRYYPTLTAILAAVTHPLSAILLGSLILVTEDRKGWIKAYAVPLGAFWLQLNVFFGGVGFGGGRSLPIMYQNVFILLLALGLSYWAVKRSRRIIGGAIALFSLWVVLGYFGLWIPTPYFDRVGFLLLLPVIPFLVKKVITTTSIKYITIGMTSVLLTLAGVYAGTYQMVPDDQEPYENLPKEVLSELKSGRVRYASDGSALYILPQENIYFTNTGRESYSPPPDNITAYENMIRSTRTSHIIFYQESVEENFIERLNYALIYSEENLKIYETDLPDNLTDQCDNSNSEVG